MPWYTFVPRGIRGGMTTLYIKNMVCPRCVSAVEHMLNGLGCRVRHVGLGEAIVDQKLTAPQHAALAEGLEHLGFELLEDRQSILVENIRLQVQAWVRLEGGHPRLSDYLQQNLRRDYSTLSKLFSAVRGLTIERYSVVLRVERAKELLSYGQQSVSEIAYGLGYSSPAHLSAQFKQETGMSPSAFQREHRAIGRTPIDRL